MLTLENGEELDMRLLLRNDEVGFRVVGFSFRPKQRQSGIFQIQHIQ